MIEVNLKRVKGKRMVVGLPGVGFVGHIAVSYMVSKLKPKKVGEIFCYDFPPQIIIRPDGLFEPRRIDIFKKGNNIFVLGTDQPSSFQGQYLLAKTLAEMAKKMGVKEIFTLAGFGSGKRTKEPRVFGTGTEKMVKSFKKRGVLFGVFGPQAVIGVAGLTITFAQKYGMEALCLMGETPGGYIDPKAAKKVLEIVCDYCKVKLDMGEIDQKAKEFEAALKRIEEQIKASQKMQPRPNLTYIR